MCDAKKKKKKKRADEIIGPVHPVNNKKIVHIHLHSIYSDGDAMCKPDELVKRAVELGIDTIVLTDHGTIAGVIQMYKACKKAGIKFIPACEMYESPDRLVKVSRDDNYHITILPMNNQGWYDLQVMIADANSRDGGLYYDPRTDMQFIEQNGYGKNLIATSGCLGSYTSQLLLKGKYDEAKAEIIRRSKIFGAYFLEIQDNGSPEQNLVNHQLIQISKETGVPLVYAKDVHYVRPEDKDAHHAMVAISRKKTIYECHPYPGTNTYHFAGADEVYEWATNNNIPLEALENTVKIAEMCNVDLELGRNLMPEYPFCEAGHDPKTYLRKLLYDNLIEYVEKCAKKGKQIDVKAYIERIETEYEVITMKGYPSYFLILWDIILFATNRRKWLSYPANRTWISHPENAKYEFYPQWYVGPGRGSAAGAMIAFLLGITKLDPIEYDLMFERFLNPYRNSPPDIDVDFPGDNHDLLLDFVAQRYGRDRTAQIQTFGKYKIKSAIDRICSALEKRDPNDKRKVIAYGKAVANEVKKVIIDLTGKDGKMPDQSDCTYKKMMEIAEKPEEYQSYGPSLPKFIEGSKIFRAHMEKYPELHEYLRKIEGCIASKGIHAGGIIISNRPLYMDAPTMVAEKSKAVLPVTLFDYPDAEEIGLLKMDLLRTATLKTISITIDLIRQIEGEEIDIYNIGRDDEATFKTIADGYTHGLFQINGSGITQYTREVKPRRQEEVIDILALYRPGPLDATLDNGNTIAKQYALNGGRPLKEILKEVNKNVRQFVKKSRGQMIYQEQIMQIVQEVAGYNLGHADTFRRVIGKKKISEMPKLYDEFMYGHKYVIKKLTRLIEKFDTMKHVYDDKDTEKQTPLIELKSFDGKTARISKMELENDLKSAKEAMAIHEIIGAVPNGYDEKFAHNLFEQMAAFAGYAFNKSHSACYADETFQTAWLKTHYPIHFMTALLSVRGGDADTTLDNLKEAKRMGIKILPPHINHSGHEFLPENGNIRYGLFSIKDVGEAAVSQILRIRNEGGPYTSFDDFVKRNSFKGSNVKRTNFQVLIKAGCFDDFEPNRYKLLNYYNFDVRKDKVYDGTEEQFAKEDSKVRANHSIRWNEAEFNDMRRLKMELDLIGIYVSGSPYEDLPYTPLEGMKPSTWRDKEMYDIGGRITNVITKKDRKGKDMAWITLETQLAPIRVTIFSGTYPDVAQHLYKDNIVVVRGFRMIGTYNGRETDDFICEKILTKQGNKIKKQMGYAKKKEEDQLTPVKEEIPIMEQLKPKKKADPVAELFDKPKKEKSVKKSKKKGVDLSKYKEAK